MCPGQLKTLHSAVSACIPWLLQSTCQTIPTTAGTGETSFQELLTNPQPFPVPAILASTLEATVFLLSLKYRSVPVATDLTPVSIDILSMQATYRSVKFSFWIAEVTRRVAGLWWRLKEEVGEWVKPRQANDKSISFHIPRCQKTSAPAGLGPPASHQQHIKPSLKPGQKSSTEKLSAFPSPPCLCSGKNTTTQIQTKLLLVIPGKEGTHRAPSPRLWAVLTP